MNDIQLESETEEIRTCEDCGMKYTHEPCFLLGEEDLNKDNYKCPSCEKKQMEAWEKKEEERRQREAKEARERARQASWENLVPKTYRETDIDHPNYPRDIHKLGMEWVEKRKKDDVEAKLCFGLTGRSGICKTRVIAQLMKQFVWKGLSCEWVNTTKFTRLVQNQFSNLPHRRSSVPDGSSQTEGEACRKQLERYRTCDVLAIDDLGKGRLTDTVEAALYDLMEERTSEGRAIVWTSNATYDDLLKMLSEDRGGPIVRRLISFSETPKL